MYIETEILNGKIQSLRPNCIRLRFNVQFEIQYSTASDNSTEISVKIHSKFKLYSVYNQLEIKFQILFTIKLQSTMHKK